MLNCLSLLDFYGSNFSFTLEKKKKFTTSFGGILTIITGIALIILFVVLGNDMFDRNNPRTSISKYLTKQHPQINLSEYDIEIGIKISQLNNNHTEELMDFTGDFLYSKFMYETKYIDAHNNTQIAEFETYAKKCSNNNFVNAVDNPGSYNCFNLSQLFGGKLSPSTNTSTLNLYIANCKFNAPNGSPFIKCISASNLTDTFKKHNTNPYIVSIKYPKFYYSPWMKNQPVSIEYQTLSFPFDHNLQRIDKLYFQNNIANEDMGWWFENIYNKSYWTIESMNEYYNYKTNEDLEIRYSSSILYTLSLEMSFDTTSYLRTYQKFQDLLAIVTSMIKIITIGFEMCSYIINSSIFQLYLMNLFFDLNPENVVNTNIKSLSEKSFTGNLTNANCINQMKTKKTMQSNYTKEFSPTELPKMSFESIKQFKNKKTFTNCFAFRSYLHLTTKSDQARLKLYDYGSKLIKNEIELSRYIKALCEIMIIKKAIFNKDQLEKIMGINKPHICNNEEIDEIYGLNMSKKNVNVNQVLELCSTVCSNKNKFAFNYPTPKCSFPLGSFVQKIVEC